MPPARKHRPDVMPSVAFTGLTQVRARDLLVRFALGAIVSVTAAVLAKAVNARFAGAFLAFPAILPASLTLIQDKEGTRDADRNAIGAVLGGFALVPFAIVGEALFTRLAPAAVLVVALATWRVASLALYALLAVVQPDACDKHQD